MSDPKKPVSLVDLVGAVAGRGRVDAEKIWAEVQANHKRLRECERPHDFKAIDERQFGGKSTCTKCGGTLDNINVLYYREGLVDGSTSTVAALDPKELP